MPHLTTPEVIDFPGTPTVVVRGIDVPTDDLAAFMDAAFSALGAAIGAGVFTPSGPAFSRYEDAPGATATLEAGFPVAHAIDEPGEHGGQQLAASELPAGRIAIAKHHGAYDALGDSWGELLTWVGEQGLTPGVPFWEAYDTEPTPEMNPDDLVTGLAVPIP
ncbi:GyrI-like domain-containing protein [Gulosibacter faecalis]|jgi:effector-binding domain-containing protein|uniref:GyrI-like domain-containing protein n=1 Tax=Gulosibacter faecalis TaxID=272240 RepID=A0ABW5UXD6_9MICO|nr:GyrI-like domain-containing protein [Gulosibacter faecalis]